MEGFLTVFIFIGVMAVTALLFGVWLIVSVVRVVARGVGRVLAPPRLPPMPSASRGITCPHERCAALNPATARFCRRCGRALPETQRVSVRRAALW